MKSSAKRENNEDPEEMTEANKDDSSALSEPEDGIEELIEDLPPKTRRELVASVLSIQQRFGPQPNPVFSKLNESHLDKTLDIVQRDSDKAHELRKSNRVYYLIYFWSVIIVLGAAVVWLLPSYPEFLDTILKILLGFVGGFGAGYGLKSRID